MTPLLMVEDEEAYRDQSDAISRRLGRPVDLVGDFPALVARLDEWAADPAAPAPVIVLDPGVPGVCRLDAVRLARKAHPSARIVAWTFNREPAFHSATVLDGALACIQKSRARALDILTGAVERADRGRTWLEPAQAQWFFEFVSLAKLVYVEGKTSIWKHTELEAAGFGGDLEDALAALAAVAEGEPFGDDDRWFQTLLEQCRKLWLTPHLRQTLTALAVFHTRKLAAEAIDKNLGAMNGYCGKLSGRLEPGRHLARAADASAGETVLMRWVITNHAGCEQSDADHDLSPEGADVPRPTGPAASPPEA